MEYKKILLDPGHGFNLISGRYGRPLMKLGDNQAIIVPGSMKPHKNDRDEGYYREDFGTLAIAKHAKDRLKELGYEVFMTRNDDQIANAFLSKELKGTAWQIKNWKSHQWITKAADKWDCDALVSIHTNAGGGTGLTGFYDSIIGRDFASIILEELNVDTGLKLRKIVKKSFMILRKVCGGRTCLLECGFHDNHSDLKYLVNPDNLKVIGVSIANGIHQYLKP